LLSSWLIALSRYSKAALSEGLAGKVREVIAGHFGIPRDRLTDRARFRDDLKADRLDRLELVIAIEDRVAGLRIDDAVVERLETIGDLMHAIGATRKAG
jgi:acyl carrier protein